MYTLLVVDDEKWVRQGLRLTMDWEAEGIELLGEAEDADEAFKLIDMITPDIIITDIKMPGMDGLSLIQSIRNRGLHTKAIIISGYSDFNYAQKALKLGAYDYVLKPIQENNLLEVVRRCVIELEKENKSHNRIEQMSGCIRESLPLARHQYLEMLLTGGTAYALGDMETKWNAFSIGLDPNRLTVLAVKIHNWGIRGSKEKDHSSIRYALGNIAEEIGMRWGITVACPLNYNNDADLAILFSEDSRPKEVHEVEFLDGIVSLIEATSQYLGIQISIGISEQRDRVMSARSFEESLLALSFAFYEGFGKIYVASQLSNKQSNHIYAGPNHSWENRVIHAMKLGEEDALGQLVKELIDPIESNRDNYSPLNVYRRLTSLLQSVASKWESAFSTSEETYVPKTVSKLRIPPCTLSQLKHELWSMLVQCIQEMRASRNHKRVIEMALSYIKEHFTEAIKMNDVAEQHYLNPSYFSKIFHEEMGETFTKYIARLRISKAKILLKDSTFKIYEIAEQVGYNDFRHFVKIFKELEGMTPVQFRNLGI